MQIELGQKVAVYRNLNKPGLFSIKALEGVNKGKVIGYSPSVEIAGVTFKVSEASRQRVLRDKQRNVHAFAVGTLVACTDPVDVAGMTAATYQPYTCGSFFIRDTGLPVSTANRCVLQGANAFIA